MTGAAPRRIGIVVTDAYADEDPDHDTPLLLEALRARGVAAESVVWHDAGVDLGAFELLVIRSPWDYPERPAEFVAWLDRAAAAIRGIQRLQWEALRFEPEEVIGLEPELSRLGQP